MSNHPPRTMSIKPTVIQMSNKGSLQVRDPQKRPGDDGLRICNNCIDETKRWILRDGIKFLEIKKIQEF